MTSVMTFLPPVLFALVIIAALLKAAIGFINAPTDYKARSPESVLAETAPELEAPILQNESATSEDSYATRAQIPTNSSTHLDNPYAAPSVSAGMGAIPMTDPMRSPTVPSPSFAKALGMVLLQVGAVVALYLLINAIPSQIIKSQPLRGMSLLVLSFLGTSIIYSLVLPTSFGKAAFVFLIQILLAATAAIPAVMIICLIASFI